MDAALVQQFINPIVQALNASGEKLAVQFSLPFYGFQLQMNFSLLPDQVAINNANTTTTNTTVTETTGTSTAPTTTTTTGIIGSTTTAGMSQQQTSLSNGYSTARRY